MIHVSKGVRAYDCMFSKTVLSSRKLFRQKMVLQEFVTYRDAEGCFLFRMPHFVLEMFADLEMFCGSARV